MLALPEGIVSFTRCGWFHEHGRDLRVKRSYPCTVVDLLARPQSEASAALSALWMEESMKLGWRSIVCASDIVWDRFPDGFLPESVLPGPPRPLPVTATCQPRAEVMRLREQSRASFLALEWKAPDFVAA